MLIKITDFKGLIPKVDPKNLPGANAQIANNVTVYSGKVESQTESDIPSAENKESIATPSSYTVYSAPTAASSALSHLFDASAVTCRAWIFRLEDGDLKYTWNPTLTLVSYSYTDTGVRCIFRTPAYPRTLIWTLTPDDDPLTNEFRGGQYLISAGGGSIPDFVPSTLGAPMFGSNGIELSDGSHKYAELRISSVENGDFYKIKTMYPSTKGHNKYYEETLGQRDIIFNFDMGYGQNLPKYTYYIQSYVDGDGIEGPPSLPSNQVERIPGKRVVVTGTNGARLYRSATGTKSENFFYLDTFSSTTYTDWKTDEDLGEALEQFYGNRPTGISGLARFPGNVLVGYVDTTVYFSAPDRPHAWPEEYSYELNIYPTDGSDGEIIGLEVIGNSVHVMTNAESFVISGYHPENMSVQKLAFNYPCVSSSSICRINDVIYYASENGIVMERGLSSDIVTYDFLTAEGWNALIPADMTITYAGDRLYVSGISSSGTDQEPLGVTATALMFELRNYIPVNMVTINSATKMTWRSKRFETDRPVTFGCARVVADRYSDLTLKLYAKTDYEQADAVLVYTRVIPNDQAFHITSEYPSKIWEIELIASTATKIDAVMIATSMKEMRGGQ